MGTAGAPGRAIIGPPARGAPEEVAIDDEDASLVDRLVPPGTSAL